MPVRPNYSASDDDDFEQSYLLKPQRGPGYAYPPVHTLDDRDFSAPSVKHCFEPQYPLKGRQRNRHGIAI